MRAWTENVELEVRSERRKGVRMKRPRRKTQSCKTNCMWEWGRAVADTPSWASHCLNILKCQECKVLTALFLGHYSRLCWQQGTLRGEVLTPFRTKSSLANAQYWKQWIPWAPCSSAVVQTHCVRSIYLGLCVTPVAQGGPGEPVQTWCSRPLLRCKKVLCLWPKHLLSSTVKQ